jgi:hypothetical protein
MITHLFGQYSLLDLVAVLEKLLDDIVAKDVRHELKCVGLNLTENLILLIAIGGFQFLLDETGSMLISTKLYHVIIYVFKFVSLVSLCVGSELFQNNTSNSMTNILITGWTSRNRHGSSECRH